MKKYDFELLMTSEEFKENQRRIMEELDRQQEANLEQLKSLETRDFILKVMLGVVCILTIILGFHFLADIDRENKLNMYEKCNGDISETYDPYSHEKMYVCK